jgi:hypothetical protein
MCRKRLARNLSEEIVDKYREKNLDEQQLQKKIEEVFIAYEKATSEGKSLEDNHQLSFYDHDQQVVMPNTKVRDFEFSIHSQGKVVDDSIGIGDDIAILKIPVTNAPTLEIGDSDQVNIQDPILTVGYPTNDLNSKSKPDSLSLGSILDASVQKGYVASNPKKLKSGYPVLQIDIQLGRGSGGSPLIDNKGKVVGMLVSRKSWAGDTEILPLAIPTSTINEFIDRAGTSNNHGEATNQLYKQGLELYFKKDYKEAIKKFERVKGLYKIDGVSAHTQAQQLIEIINQIEAGREVKPWTDPFYQLIFGLIAGGGVVAAVAYFLLRHQLSARKASPGSAGVSAEGRAVFTNSNQRNGFGTLQSWLELEYQGQIRRFQLYKDEHRLGRDPAWSDLQIPTSWEVISRHHAILQKEGEDYRIYDGDGKVPSRNGLWIDDNCLVDPQDGYPLKNGDRLKIGKDPHEQVVLTYFNSTTSQAEAKETKTAD